MFAATKLCDSALQAALLLLPTVAALVAFLYYPASGAFRLSPYETLFLRQRQAWAGLRNFVALLTSGAYQYSLFVTVMFVAVVIFGTLGVSLLIGYLILPVDVRSSVYLVAAIWPYALPPAAAAILLNFIPHPNLGIFTHYLELLTPLTLDWFNDGLQALATLAVVAVWRQLGYNIIFIVAVLNNIPEILTGNAHIDGVGRFGMLYKMCVPMVAPMMTFLVVMNTIYAFFSTFPLVDLMTNGGPNNATNLLIFRLYRDTFQFNSPGLTPMQSVTLFVVASVLMYIQLRSASDYGRYGR